MKKLLIILALLTSFACHRIKKGRVETMYVKPGYLERYSTHDKYGTHWHTRYHREEYRVIVSGFDYETGKKTPNETFYVTQREFNCLRVGGAFNADAPCENAGY